MKNIRIIVFTVLATVAIGILFSFKNDQATKEIGTIIFHETSRKDAIIVHMGEEVKKITTEDFNDEKKFLSILNQYIAEGWAMVSTDYTSTGAYTSRVVYMEKVK